MASTASTLLGDTSLFIAGCARDCQGTVMPLLQTLQTLGSLCKDYRICVVENDSKDATRTILEQAQQNNENILLPNFSHYIKEKDYTVSKEGNIQYNAQRVHDSSLQKHHMQERVMRIALARDCYLDTLSTSNFVADYIMMLDFDLVQCSLKGILSSIELLKSWDVLTANGMSVSRQSYFLPLYYDSYALDMQEHANEGFSWQPNLQRVVTKKLKLLQRASAEKQVLPVYSAFAGLALYKAALLHTTRYIASCEKDNFAYCEHVSLHRQLRVTYGATIAINPHMPVYVSNYSSLFKKLLQRFFPLP